MARPTLSALIGRVRTMINDPWSPTALFTDDEIQDVLDASRQDVKNMPLRPQQTFTGTQYQWLDYYSDPGMTDWEDDAFFRQYLTTVVTPSVFEPIAGHWQFATSTSPPVLITGK